jgi:hypothetical protein
MEPTSSFSMFFMWMGPFKIPMILLSLVVLGIIAKKKVDLFLRKGLPPEKLKWGLNSILFWGIFTFVFGLFAQTLGIWKTLQAIMYAPDISPPILINGLLGTFSPTIYGLCTLLVAMLNWWILRERYHYLKNRK